MFFDETNLDINIISILELRWEESHAYAAARPYHALSYRINGSADFTHGEKTMHVNAGEIAYVPAGFDYRIDADSEHLFVIHFDISSPIQISEMETMTPADIKYFTRKFQSIHSVWSKKQFAYQYECKSDFYRILMKLCNEQSKQKADYTNDKMNDISEYIHEHFTEPTLSVALLAEMAGMSDTYFRKLFVTSFSVTPLKYINNLRISYGIELLRSGYYSVDAAAEKSGFANQKYFSTVLKKLTGHSPISYRKYFL